MNVPGHLVLKEDTHRRIVRVGDTVRRPMYPWSSSVHLLLRHLESVDFPHSPRFLGIDAEGREVLSFVEGISGGDGYVEGIESGAHAWAMVVPSAGLARFARLLRDYHDAVARFRPPEDSPWSAGLGPPGRGQVLCHGDFGPWNVVWSPAGEPLVIIDWDYAAPGTPIEDVAYALEWSVPFCPDEECLKWRRFDAPPDRASRLEMFATAYGLSSTKGLVDAVIRRQRDFKVMVQTLGARGIQPAADELTNGYLDVVDERIRWSEDHRLLLE